MKKGRDLRDVLIELNRQQAEKKDYISPSSSLSMKEDGQVLLMGDKEFGTTDLFHRQVASTLNIPVKYYDLMRSEKPELLAENVNSWFGSREQNYMVRSLSGTARALLSDRYRRIDNLEVAGAVLPLFAGMEGLEVMSCEVSDSRMYIKVVNHRLEMACVGDRVQAGVVISNSEVGLGAVSVQPLVYTLACTNGMIVNSMGERKTHVGRASKSLEAGWEILSDETRAAEDTAFVLKLKDIVKSAIDEARFGLIVGKLAESANAKISGRVQDVIEVTGKEYGLSLPEQDGVLKYLIQGGDLSLYGLSNAVTRYSQDVESYDRATELEAVGWDMATMEAGKWKEINA